MGITNKMKRETTIITAKKNPILFTKVNIHGIGFKLIGIFLIPVALIIVLGLISYTRAADALTENYKTTVLKTVESTGEYLTLGLAGVEKEVLTLITDDDFSVYYNGESEDGIQEDKNWKALHKRFAKVLSSNEFVYSFNVLSGYGKSYASKGDLTRKYNAFLESDEAKLLQDKSTKLWAGYHPFIDENVNISSNTYALSYAKPFVRGEGYVFIDVKMNKVLEVLHKINFGEGSSTAFISGDGRQIDEANPHNILFSTEEYFVKALESEKSSGVEQVIAGGVEQLFLFSKIGKTGSVICALVPMSIILSQANVIRLITFAVVTTACLIAILIGFFFTKRIDRTVKAMQRGLLQASEGDLTSVIAMNRKDEFQSLADSVNLMLRNMRELIKNASGVGHEVTYSSGSVEQISQVLLSATKEINFAIDEIERGVNLQAEDSAKCLLQMSALAERITDVYDNTQEIKRFMDDTRTLVGHGTALIDELMEKTKATSKITEVVIEDMNDLEVASNSIVDIVGVIDSISEQTNLLSLNASIEAARAGEAGKGFGVVAHEIRKLSEQSRVAANKISKIIVNIQNKTRETVESTGEAKLNVISQEESLKNTVEMFYQMNSYVESLAGNLQKIGVGIEGIEQAKNDTLHAIENISAISEETASASEEVGKTIANQLDIAEKLSQASLKLGNNAKLLEDSIRTFTV